MLFESASELHLISRVHIFSTLVILPMLRSTSHFHRRNTLKQEIRRWVVVIGCLYQYYEIRALVVRNADMPADLCE
jgi:hypothetical protein